MATYLINSTTLTDIADAIRDKTGYTDVIRPSQMASMIANIESGIIYTEKQQRPSTGSVWTQNTVGVKYTSNDGTIIEASSYYSSNYLVKNAFGDKISTSGWASSVMPTPARPQTIKVTLPSALRKISVSLYSRDSSSVSNPGNGEIWCSNKVDEDELSEIDTVDFSFQSTVRNGLIGTIDVMNDDPRDVVEIRIHDVYNSTQAYVAIGRIVITGFKEVET